MTGFFERINSLILSDKYSKFTTFFNIGLIIVILVNIILKFQISLNYPLNSDLVSAGVASYEIWANHNFFLINYYVPQVDPFYFTDIYTFQLIPQIVTNFNPAVLKIVGFIIFCLLILIFGKIIYKISKNFTFSIIFGALISSMPVLTYNYYAQIYHVGTMVLIGVLFLLLYDFPELKLYNYLASFIILCALVISDSLVWIWFVIPGLIYYFYQFYLTKINWNDITISKFDTRGLWFVIFSLFSVSIISGVTKFFIPYFFSYRDPLHIVGPDILTNQIITFFNHLVEVFAGTINNIIQFSPELSILDFLAVIMMICLLIYAILSGWKRISRNFIIFFICTIISIFILLVFTNLGPETRYMLIIGPLLLMIVSLSYEAHDKIFTLILILVLILNTSCSILEVNKYNSSPNQDEINLIDFLKSNDLHYGVGDYWDSNLITYLSGHEVTVRAVLLYGDVIIPYRWVSSESWYSPKELSKVNFILVRNISPSYRPYINRDTIRAFLEKHPPSKTLHQNDYDVYIFSPVKND